MPTSDEGADDVGDDIELGNLNHGIMGTELELDLPDGANSYADTVILVVGPAVPLATGVPVNGIQAVGTAGGSALVGTVSLGGGAAIIGQGSSSTNPGVLGSNDMGTGVTGTSAAMSGTGVSGICTATSGTGVSGSCAAGTGVFGESSTGSGVAGNSDLGTGVFGECPTGTGVMGSSPSGTGVIGESQRGNGAIARSEDAPALFATCVSERAGVFLSGPDPQNTGPMTKTTKGGIAQIRLVPSQDSKVPTKGRIGDLYLHRVTVKPPAVNLYLCINDSPVQWQQVQLAPTIYPGGATAP